jgi:hypothetical protein
MGHMNVKQDFPIWNYLVKLNIKRKVTFKPIMTKIRGKNGGILVGNDIQSKDILKYNIKTPFEEDFVVDFETQVNIKIIFLKLSQVNNIKIKKRK